MVTATNERVKPIQITVIIVVIMITAIVITSSIEALSFRMAKIITRISRIIISMITKLPIKVIIMIATIIMSLILTKSPINGNH